MNAKSHVKKSANQSGSQSAVPLSARQDRADSEARKQRSDGVEARARLLHMALRLFAEKGFSKTSTREIAQAAGANLASIKYYFGDKAGLYRAVFSEPMGNPGDDIDLYNQPHFSLRQSLAGFYGTFLEPMKQGDLVQLCTRLHFREMLEPTGMWSQEIDCGIKPAHAALVAVLCRHLGAARADDDIHRLAFSIAGMGLQMFITRDVIHAIRPKLIATSDAVDQWGERLVTYAEAMVAAEAACRKKSAAGKIVTAISGAAVSGKKNIHGMPSTLKKKTERSGKKKS